MVYSPVKAGVVKDIDTDSSSSKRGAAIDAVAKEFKKFGSTLAGIATYGTEKSKSAVLTAARGLGLDTEDGLYFSSLIPSDRGFVRSLHDCYYGTDEKQPVKEFVEAMDANPEVWKIAQQIEGLKNRLGAHASGFVFFKDGEMYKQTGLVKTPGGQMVTQFNLSVMENLGGVKYDFLSTEGEDAIQTELMLLAEYGYIDWKGTLRETYNHYLHPKVLEYDDKTMWKMVHDKKILSIFQFDTPVGEQAIMEVQPDNLYELAIINAVMRLMAPEGGEMPLITYRRRKANIGIWYREMDNHGLTKEEQQILEPHVLSSYGMCVTQEQLMELVQDPKISNFSFLDSDSTRKVVSKKKMSEIDKLKDKFFSACEKNGARLQFANYIWTNLFAIQLG